MIMLTRLVTVVLQDKWHSTHDKTLSHTSHAHTPAPPTQMDCRLQALRSAVTEKECVTVPMTESVTALLSACSRQSICVGGTGVCA